MTEHATTVRRFRYIVSTHSIWTVGCRSADCVVMFCAACVRRTAEGCVGGRLRHAGGVTVSLMNRTMMVEDACRDGVAQARDSMSEC